MSVELGYWKIRGLGAPLRMILTYAEVDFKDVQYADGESWFKGRKPALLEMNPLANLPYIVDGDKCVCQTNAVFYYVGEKFGLNGSTPEEKLNNEQLLCEIYDVRNKMIDLVYPFKQVVRSADEFEKMVSGIADAPPFDKFEAWLNKTGTPYFCGASPLTCDFHIWEMLDQYEKCCGEKTTGKPSVISRYPKCAAFHAKLKGEGKLAKYFASDAYKLPCNNPGANPYFF